MKGNGHTAHRNSQLSLPVYWTIRPINWWLWGGHVKPSDWLSWDWQLIAWHPCSCPRFHVPAPRTDQWGDRKQHLQPDLDIGYRGQRVDGWMKTSGVFNGDLQLSLIYSNAERLRWAISSFQFHPKDGSSSSRSSEAEFKLSWERLGSFQPLCSTSHPIFKIFMFDRNQDEFVPLLTLTMFEFSAQNC